MTLDEILLAYLISIAALTVLFMWLGLGFDRFTALTIALFISTVGVCVTVGGCIDFIASIPPCFSGTLITTLFYLTVFMIGFWLGVTILTTM